MHQLAQVAGGDAIGELEHRPVEEVVLVLDQHATARAGLLDKAVEFGG